MIEISDIDGRGENINHVMGRASVDKAEKTYIMAEEPFDLGADDGENFIAALCHIDMQQDLMKQTHLPHQIGSFDQAARVRHFLDRSLPAISHK